MCSDSSAVPHARGRAVVADESGFMRRLLRRALEDAGFEVVGEAADGDEALALCRRHRPEVMTLDLAMPGLDGLGVLRELAELQLPTVTVVVCAFTPADGARAVDALAEGAFELVPKPGIGDAVHRFLETLSHQALAAASASSARTARSAAPGPVVRRAPAPGAGGDRIHEPRLRSAESPVLLIAGSTGGPHALAALLPRLPQELGAGALIVQQMPAGFTAPLAERLDRAGTLSVREARQGDDIEPGVVLLAPGGRHLRIQGPAGSASVALSTEDPVGGLRPRADLAIADAVAVFGSRLVLVVLSGMGTDGLAGARAVRAAGGRVLAEAESSCVVYGTPRAVAEAELADAVVDLERLPAAIIEAVLPA